VLHATRRLAPRHSRNACPMKPRRRRNALLVRTPQTRSRV
jgi:hypothetical protein